MSPVGLLFGTVTNPDGWPLVGVTVTVLGATGTQVGRAVTDADGSFELKISDDPLTLVVAGAGLRPYARAVGRSAADGSMDIGRIVLGEPTGRDHPPSGIWDIDPVHSIVKATARHLGLTRVEGRFLDLGGRLEIGESIAASSVTVSIVTASLTTGNDDRDTHLRSADFLDVDRFPELTFRSRVVGPGTTSRWRVDGDITIRDITRPVALDMTYQGSGPDPWGGTRAAFSATTQLNRRDFEMNWNMGLPGGMLLVGPVLRIDLDVQAVLRAG